MEASTGATPHTALGRWIDLYVDFLVTKLGLAAVLQSDDPCYDPMHSYFLQRLEPVCAQLLDAAAGSGEIRPGLDAYELMRGVAGLCAGAGNNPRYDARGAGDAVLPRATPQARRAEPHGPS
ncbi:MAG: hypothetical protein ABSB76_04985 [Streptosporangiaceae bacterium]